MIHGSHATRAKMVIAGGMAMTVMMMMTMTTIHGGTMMMMIIHGGTMTTMNMTGSGGDTEAVAGLIGAIEMDKIIAIVRK